MNPTYTKKEIEEIVKIVRLELYNSGLFCGPKAIKERLQTSGCTNHLKTPKGK